MPLRNDLLNPIPGDNPAGKSYRYDPLYDEIKDARREERSDAQGDWQYAIKQADWVKTIKLTSSALASKSKDLQLAVWLAQALLHREGLTSFRDALVFIRQLLETFWDNLHPEPEDGDLEPRKAPLEWLGTESDREPTRPVTTLRFTPLTNSGLTYAQFLETREVGTEDAADTWDKQTARANKIKDGKTAPEVFEKDFETTPKKFYVDLEHTFDDTLAELKKIETFCDEKFEDESPNLHPLNEMLTGVRTVVHTLVVRKREKEPDPVTETAAEPEEGAAPEAQPEETTAAPAAGAAPAVAVAPAAAASRAAVAAVALTPLPGSWEDAVARVVAAARFMRQNDPHNPAPYLMLRGLRWGELRSSGKQIDPAKLAGPPPEIRQNLRRARMESQWTEVLETSETAMGMECGRGWLDLQRYVVLACQELGGYYEPIRRAVVAELGMLLEVYPQLPELTMMDDMPAANAETQAWIRKQVVRPAERGAEEAEPSPNGAAPPSRWFEVAMQAAKSNRPEISKALLAKELARESCGRGRFQRRVQLAQLCEAAGNEAMALSLYQEAAAEIEEKHLEEWEAREVLTHALGLLYRCLVKSGASDEKDQVYERICRLDPMEALKLER